MDGAFFGQQNYWILLEISLYFTRRNFNEKWDFLRNIFKFLKIFASHLTTSNSFSSQKYSYLKIEMENMEQIERNRFLLNFHVLYECAYMPEVSTSMICYWINNISFSLSLFLSTPAMDVWFILQHKSLLAWNISSKWASFTKILQQGKWNIIFFISSTHTLYSVYES